MLFPGTYAMYRETRRKETDGDVENAGEASNRGDVEEGVDEETPLRRGEGRAGVDT